VGLFAEFRIVGFLEQEMATDLQIASEEWIASRMKYAMQVLREYVEIDVLKRGGVPVLKGTRFTVAQLLAELAEGRSTSEIAEDFELEGEVIKNVLENLAILLDRPAIQ
jgi:uncharacterized protein (DUF433 family)